MLSFVLPRLAWLLVRPSTLLLLASLAAVALVWAGRVRWGRRLAAVTALAVAACVLLPVDEALTLPLEQRFVRPDPAPGHVDGIVVLGGAVDPYLTAEHGTPSLNADAERMTAFLTLARAYPAARLAFTGGNGRLSATGLSEADVAALLFRSLGLDRPVLYEDMSRSTHENAVLLRRMMEPRPGETWLLVTSAMHMPRAVASFRAARWPVVPWPVSYHVGRRPRFDLEPSWAERLAGLDRAVHEWAGLAGYRLAGLTDALFPAP